MYKLDYPTQWSDGVPFVTQCPILPKVNYTWYTFDAIPAGTHWYHSHSEFQRDDGVFGALIVKERTDQINDMPKPVIGSIELTVSIQKCIKRLVQQPQQQHIKQIKTY